MWFLFDAGYPVKPFIFQVEKETALVALNQPGDDHVFKHHEFLYQAYGRYNAGYGLPELAYGSDGTTGP
jgi:phage major head subunit gpT-like protein